MGLIRLIVIALAVWIAWKMFQNYKVKQARRRPGTEVLERERMVKCGWCDVHLPEKAALRHDDRWFCSDDHKARYLEGGGR